MDARHVWHKQIFALGVVQTSKAVDRESLKNVLVVFYYFKFLHEEMAIEVESQVDS